MPRPPAWLSALLAAAVLIVPLWGVLDRPLGLEPGQGIALGIVLAALILWVTEAVPLFVTSVGIGLAGATLLAPSLGVASDTFITPFASDVILLFLGGFVLSAVLERHGLAERAACQFFQAAEADGSAVGLQDHLAARQHRRGPATEHAVAVGFIEIAHADDLLGSVELEHRRDHPRCVAADHVEALPIGGIDRRQHGLLDVDDVLAQRRQRHRTGMQLHPEVLRIPRRLRRRIKAARQQPRHLGGRIVGDTDTGPILTTRTGGSVGLDGGSAGAEDQKQGKGAGRTKVHDVSRKPDL